MSGLLNKSTIALPLSTTVVFTDLREDEMVNVHTMTIHICYPYYICSFAILED